MKNNNIIRDIRLKIDSWNGYGYHFHYVKVFKELFEKGWVPVCYNKEKVVIRNTVKQIS